MNFFFFGWAILRTGIFHLVGWSVDRGGVYTVSFFVQQIFLRERQTALR